MLPRSALLRWKFRFVGLLALASSAYVGNCVAQETVSGYPSKPIQIIVPVAPGSSSDATARHIGNRLSAKLGQPVVIENRPGAGTRIALQTLLSAPADGHAMMVISPSSMVVGPLSIENWDIDVGAIRPVVQVARAYAALVVSSTSKYQTVEEYFDAARAHPGAVSIATYSPHYETAVVDISQRKGLNLNSIRYKGASDSLAQVVGGIVDSMIVDVSAVKPLVEGGKLRVLAVTSPERLPAFPQVPTLREQGLSGFEFSTWYGFGVRRETPDPIVKLLESEVIAIVKTPEFATFNKTQGDAEIIGGDGDALEKQIADDTLRYRQLMLK